MINKNGGFMHFLVIALMLGASALAVETEFIKSFNCYKYAEKQIQLPSNHYFNERTRPEITFSRSHKLCADLDYGLNDSPFSPLMNEKEEFKVISLVSPEVYDRDGNGQSDIEDRFMRTLWNDYRLNAGSYRSLGTLFDGEHKLGYMVNPMFGQVATCPRAGDFTPVAQTLMKVYGHASEPLYKAVRKPVYILQNGQTVALPEDVIFVSESQILGAAYYNAQGRLYLFDRLGLERNFNVQANFLWPVDKKAPFVKKANQQEYEIRIEAPAKKMVGCIPSQL
jgi:hypothetical protein